MSGIHCYADLHSSSNVYPTSLCILSVLFLTGSETSVVLMHVRDTISHRPLPWYECLPGQLPHSVSVVLDRWLNGLSSRHSYQGGGPSEGGCQTYVGTNDFSPPVKYNKDRMNQLVRRHSNWGGDLSDGGSRTCIGIWYGIWSVQVSGFPITQTSTLVGMSSCNQKVHSVCIVFDRQ